MVVFVVGDGDFVDDVDTGEIVEGDVCGLLLLLPVDNVVVLEIVTVMFLVVVEDAAVVELVDTVTVMFFGVVFDAVDVDPVDVVTVGVVLEPVDELPLEVLVDAVDVVDAVEFVGIGHGVDGVVDGVLGVELVLAVVVVVDDDDTVVDCVVLTVELLPVTSSHLPSTSQQ